MSRSGASSTFFLMAEHAHELDGPAAEQYERLRPRLVETLLDGGHVRITEVADGDHRLSRPQDLALLLQLIDEASTRALID